MTGIWDLEHKFWLEGVERHEAPLAAEATMVFPEPVGVMTRAAIRDAGAWRLVFHQQTPAAS